MVSACGRYVVVFNGEIYNYPQLRRELEGEGKAFRTNSDTEVLLHLFARDGASMVNRLRGMFAFAVWDNKARSLFLARDPYGIKPLYVANDGWTVRVASQVKALLVGGRVSRDPEPAGIVGFYLLGSVPEPFTLYRDIRALPAGHTQVIDAAGPREPKLYFSIAQVFAIGSASPSPADEIHERVRAATAESVAAHLLADVEVGVFLSAGVDSGALLGLMRDAGQNKVRAITLTFDEFRGSAEDEAPLASEIAARYDAEHIVRVVSAAEFKADLPAILAAMDQPTIDGVNTWFVAKATREVGLKVALSGVGGDEILAGYPSFNQIPNWVRWLRGITAIPKVGKAWRSVLSALKVQRRNPKLLGLLEYGGSYPGAYLLRRGLFLPFELQTVLDPELVREGLQTLALLEMLENSSREGLAAPLSHVAALESEHYLRNQLLRDADWASMAHSLEIRTPLVDIALLDALAPVTPLLNGVLGKQALAEAPSIPLPDTVVTRPKTGFGVPTNRWIAAAASVEGQGKGQVSRAWGCELIHDFQASFSQSNQGICLA
jgi:asparagine synthase (glutamine-hydrolysing)